MKPKLLISACLCGSNTKYNGKNNLIKNFELIKNNFELFLVCPEVDGGLTTPRNPSEINGTKVFSNEGLDVTQEFYKGAEIALKTALDNNIKLALLKDGSPSCGSKKIYDGTFSNCKIDGMGITTRLLRNNNIEVYTENEIDLFLKCALNK